MSAKSDQFEKDVANYINESVKGLMAERPKVPTSYSDVRVIYNRAATKTTKTSSAKKAVSVKVWVEVKMNHTDNLMNPRFSFIGNKWITDEAYKSPATDILENYWNKNKEAREWIE